jgi:plasmid stabilization system protein ParE
VTRPVLWSGKALVQFDAAIDYLAAHNLEAAQKLESRILETVAALSRRPIGRPGREPETYEKKITGTPYLVVYELDGKIIESLRILRLFHTSQDWHNEP